MQDKLDILNEKIKLLIGNHSGKTKELENDSGAAAIHYESDLEKELEKRYREIFGEED